MPEENIKELIDNNHEPFDFKIQNYLERGFQLCNQFAIGFISFYFLFLLITGTVGKLGSAGEVINRVFVTPILSVGPYFVARQIDKGMPFHFDQFWLGLKSFFPLAMMAAIQAGVYLLFLAPLFLSERGTLINEWFKEWQENPLEMTAFPEIPTMYLLCLLYTSPSPRDATLSRMPSSA